MRRALEEVLSRLSDTKALLNGERPLYIVQSSRIGGVVTLGFPSGLVLLTLNEALKERPLGEIVGIIAHELAHLALDHRFVSWEGRRKLRLREEYEADDLACQWGFRGPLIAALRATVGEEAQNRLAILLKRGYHDQRG
jgi:Zn-dependent protease with chaperone function